MFHRKLFLQFGHRKADGVAFNDELIPNQLWWPSIPSYHRIHERCMPEASQVSIVTLDIFRDAEIGSISFTNTRSRCRQSRQVACQVKSITSSSSSSSSDIPAVRFSLTAARRLATRSASGSSLYGRKGEKWLEPRSVSSQGLFRKGLSPVDCKIANNVCHPVVDLSWNASARSWLVATRHRRASSSFGHR